MAMRYLYGDSVPFPLGFDFLSTLEVFMTSATRVVMLEAESHTQANKMAVLSQARVVGVEAVQVLHQSLVQSIDAALLNIGPRGSLPSGEPHPAAYDYAKKMKDYSARVIQEQRQAEKDMTEREGAQLRADAERRAGEVRAHLEQFFKAAHMPIITSRISLKLPEGAHARNEIGVVFRNQGDIVTSFILGTDRHPAWVQPRKVADFVPGFDLMVGVKKSFFKSTVTPEVVHLDEYLISRLDVHDKGAELALRKRGEPKDCLAFKIVKTDKGIVMGEVDWPLDPNARALPPQLTGDDLVKVDGLCQTLRAVLSDMFDQREALVHLEMDGKDVFKQRLTLPLIARLVKTFAPIVEEVTSRSPSDQELSLKREHEDGKREELYLRRDDLLKKLQPLNAEGRAVFAPLGLDDWVPTLTLHPPLVQDAD